VEDEEELAEVVVVGVYLPVLIFAHAILDHLHVAGRHAFPPERIKGVHALRGEQFHHHLEKIYFHRVGDHCD